MGDASDEELELPVIIEQANHNSSDIASSSQITFKFCIAVKKGLLETASSWGSLYLELSIITDPTDIDGPKNDNNEIETGLSTFGQENEDLESESSDEEEDEENTPDTIKNMEESGRALETPQPYHKKQDLPWLVMGTSSCHLYLINLDLLLIRLCDKCKNLQESESLYYGKFLLTKIVEFPPQLEITRDL